MCTAFVKKGKDIITGFNFDMNAGGMDYCPVIEDDRVFLGMRFPPEASAVLPPSIRIRNGVRLIQGVSAGGHVAGQLCNMDFDKVPSSFAADMLTIDQLTDDFVTERQNAPELRRILETREVVNIPNDGKDAAGVPPLALHSLFVDPEGNIVFVEPGNGYAVIREKYFAVTNFSILEPPLDLDDAKFGYYGVDRYRKALGILRDSGDDFSAADGLALLRAVKQTGEWGTRFSFVYSRNENTVYYCTEGDFGNISTHRFAR